MVEKYTNPDQPTGCFCDKCGTELVFWCNHCGERVCCPKCCAERDGETNPAGRDAKTDPPNDMNEVLVSDGLDRFAVAWFSVHDKKWHASDDLLTASNYDGGCSIGLLGEPVVWFPIPPALKA